MPLISVILPVYNIKGEYLTKAVRSVWRKVLRILNC